jgi:hypothetical protein
MLFVIALIGLFIGHAIEGKRPFFSQGYPILTDRTVVAAGRFLSALGRASLTA